MPTEMRSRKRSYNSARRAQQAAQTRADVVAAAIRLFTEQGWAGTTLAAIADDAEVSVETIRNGFGSKKGLLRVAFDAAVAGDTEDVPLAERPEFLALGTGDLADRLGRGIDIVVGTQERSAGVWQALVEAASSDEEVDGWRRELDANRRMDIVRGTTALLGHELDEQAVTLLWVFWGPETYRKLVLDGLVGREEYRELVLGGTRRLLGLSDL